MSDDDILRQLCKILEPWNKAGAELASKTELGSELNIDSAAAMELIMEIEDGFDIDVNINQLGELHTIGDLVELVRSHLQKA